MKYLGWTISLLLAAGLFYTYRTRYLPLKHDIDELKQEISMWEDVLKGEKGVKGERESFPTDRFFADDKLTPFAEVEILRRAGDVIRFLAEQHIKYRNLSLYVAIDSTERFEYKFIK
jgi:hypothetical protein